MLEPSEAPETAVLDPGEAPATAVLERGGVPETVAVGDPTPGRALDATRVPAGAERADRRVVGVLVAVEGEFRGSAWALLEGPNRLGRQYSCEICLPTERVAPKHLSIEYRGGRFHVESLAEEAMELAGQPARSGTLRDGDSLRVGMTTFRFRSIVAP